MGRGGGAGRGGGRSQRRRSRLQEGRRLGGWRQEWPGLKGGRLRRATQGTRDGKAGGARRWRWTSCNKKPATDLIEGRRAVAEARPLVFFEECAGTSCKWTEGPGDWRLLHVSLSRRVFPMSVSQSQCLTHCHGAQAHIRTQPFAYADLLKSSSAGSETLWLWPWITSLTRETWCNRKKRREAGAAGVVSCNAAPPELALEHTRLPLEPCFTCQSLRFLFTRALEEPQSRRFGHVALRARHSVRAGGAPYGVALHLSGSEGSGILVLCSRSDFYVQTSSVWPGRALNVAQATTVMCYEWLQQDSWEACSRSVKHGSGKKSLLRMMAIMSCWQPRYE